MDTDQCWNVWLLMSYSRLPWQVEILVGLHNGADSDVTVEAIMGSINNPQQFSFFVQNFTAEVGITIADAL